MKIDIPFTGSSYESESSFLSPQECVNFYVRPYPELGEGKMALFGTPGLESWLSLGAGEVRGMFSFGVYLYAVKGNTFYRIESDDTITTIGTVTNSSGIVGIASNGLDIVIVGGSWGFVYDIATEVFAEIMDVDFPGGDCIAHVDGYYLVNKPGTGQIWRSDYNDGSSWSGLAFSTAGGDPDNIISIITDHRDVWIIGEVTTEIWYNTGAATFNFARIDGAFIEQGGSSHHAVTKANNAVYWLGKDIIGNAQVFQAVGRQPAIISTPPISNKISGYILSDSFMFSYQQDSHIFIVLTFPSDDITLVYDSTTKVWHSRSSLIGGIDKRWRVNSHAVFTDEHVVGDYSSGKLYKLKTDVYDECGDPMVAIRTTPVIREKQSRITVDQMHVLNEPGVGLVTGDAWDTNPQASLKWSRDGGRTWSPEVDMPLGEMSEYENRSIVRQLGQGVNWVFQYKISAAVKRVIIGAVMEAEIDD